jgi:hypothetical protein
MTRMLEGIQSLVLLEVVCSVDVGSVVLVVSTGMTTTGVEVVGTFELLGVGTDPEPDGVPEPEPPGM